MNQGFIHILLCGIIILLAKSAGSECCCIKVCVNNDIRKPFSLPCVKGFFYEYNNGKI